VIPDFDYKIPKDMESLMKLFDGTNNNTFLIAGGTDLVKKKKKKQITPKVLIDITRIKRLTGIKDEYNYISIGACCTLSKIASSPLLIEYFPYIIEAARCVGSEQIRNLGTIGGNLCSALPSADMTLPLIASDAILILSSINGTRAIKVPDFFIGYRKTALKPNEILIEIQVPKKNNQIGKFLKFGRRKTLTLAIANLAIVINFDNNSREKIEEVRIALGSVAPIPIRAKKAENFLVGKSLTKNNIEKTVNMVANEADPINDLRASAVYRVEIIKVLAKRALNFIRESAYSET